SCRPRCPSSDREGKGRVALRRAGRCFRLHKIAHRRVPGSTAMSFTSLHKFFDDVEVGQEWESPGRTVTEADIVYFAGVSGDFNPIHVDHEFARTTPFRRPVAHGLLVLSVSSGLGLHSPAMRTLAFLQIREWKFVGPVYIGDTV